jgi:pSer/pThr/pTyr-binding forkhead associated (FHA) protein
MEIIVGRKGQQRAAITDLSVSREHCKLTSNADGTYLLENLSANGTYVDGRSVVRSVVTADTVIQLGATFKIIVKDLLPVTQQKTNPAVSQTPPVDPRQKEYELKFRQLKNVYDKYTSGHFKRGIL